MKTYKIATSYGPVEAICKKEFEWEGHRFFVHRTIGLIKKPDSWSASHIETGMGATPYHGFKTIKAAIETAIKNLEQHKNEFFEFIKSPKFKKIN